ncbi:hypothetical protein B0H19DRAFT_1385491 [Mycena capillaripes]|nr:hypothetical protein B0H19DRAFT_1385491 [Mycena capillaripes]
MPSLQAILTATLFEAILESTLYGLYSVLFILVAYLFCVKPVPKRGARIYLLAALVFQYLLATGHWISTILYTCWNFLKLGGEMAESATAAIASANGDPGVSSIDFFTLSGFVAAMFAIQRLSVVWPNNLIVVINTSKVTTATGITLHVRGTIAGYALVTTSSVLALLVSGYSTTLIAWKIWRVNTDAASFRAEAGRTERTLMSFLAIIAESFFLQTTIEICILIAFVVGSGIGLTIFIPLASVMFGISTILIHARIGLGWAREPGRKERSEASMIVFRPNPTTGDSGLSAIWNWLCIHTRSSFRLA